MRLGKAMWRTASRSSDRSAVTRRLSVDDLAGREVDFFAPMPRKKPQLRLALFSCCALFVGAAIVSFSIFGSTQLAGLQRAELAPGDLDVSPLAEQPIAAWAVTQSSSKGNFRGDLAKAVSASPLQDLSVAYRQGPVTVASVAGSAAPTAAELEAEGTYPSPTADALAYAAPTVLENSFQLASLTDDGRFTSVSKTPPPEPVDETIRLQRGDTLIKRLVQLGVTVDSARAVAAAMEPVYPSRLVQVGQEYLVTLDKQQDFYGDEVIAPVRVSFTPPGGDEVVVESDDDGKFIAYTDGRKAAPGKRIANAPYFRARGQISSSLYASARDNGVPNYIINAAMNVLGHNIDLQRQIRAGDRFDLFYGNPLTGSSTKRKVLHFARLHATGRELTYYRFTDSSGRTAYYDDTGTSASKSLMRTPISGAKITSGFGMRRHPLLGYNKLHSGVDFGAPRGTPIKAAGAGVVQHVGWKGAYGRTVVVKHTGRYSTLYAHMSRTARLKPGQRVKQGQVIGYVGSTGRSTGPHLHYEVRRNNKAVNPLRVQLAKTVKLKGEDLVAFKRHKARIAAMMQGAPESVQIAQASGE